MSKKKDASNAGESGAITPELLQNAATEMLSDTGEGYGLQSSAAKKEAALDVLFPPILPIPTVAFDIDMTPGEVNAIDLKTGERAVLESAACDDEEYLCDREIDFLYICDSFKQFANWELERLNDGQHGNRIMAHFKSLNNEVDRMVAFLTKEKFYE